MDRAVSLRRALVFLLLTSFFQGRVKADPPRYVGPETCGVCHKNIGASQGKTPMAETWQGASTDWLPQHFDTTATEPPDPPASYKVFRDPAQFQWTTSIPDLPARSVPIEILMGGRRHGLGFLSRIEEIDGIPLQRPVLIQNRYAWSFTRESLVLAPGCAAARPRSFETAFGIALSPTFEARCLSCHGQPNTFGSGHSGGVRCESCHGPGSEHLQPSAKTSPTHNIVNTGKLSADDSIGVCAQCHVGLTKFSDPSPNDLLVANQVRAITSSECFIQSGKAFTCTTCHDPHGASTNEETRSIAVCLKCHSVAASPHAAICPVNVRGNCVGCHMPSVEMGPLHLVDHWIRVHPEQDVTVPPESPQSADARRSQIQPLREYLRIIATSSPATGDEAMHRLAHGADFYTVANEMSVDPSAPIGGYLGPKWLSTMEPALSKAAAQLNYGQTSAVIHAGTRSTILQRLPRNFQWQANQVQEQATAQLARGDVKGAIETALRALKIYPHFLRALIFVGTTYAEHGDLLKASDILNLATRLFPEDSEVRFEYGAILGALGRRPEEIQSYRKALELEPDLLAVYPKLGMALYSSGEEAQAVEILRRGLQINPLSADLYRDLGLVLARRGDLAASKRALALAAKIDPDYSPGTP
ncbi:MAG TPA: tetratricopeptide repeat protein [Bryobacteraceae bacterium]|jgi:Flp pilus assembly protein TadD|nr:tetratricopeptide repeat protein [Bryobacteraceae bacterium]